MVPMRYRGNPQSVSRARGSISVFRVYSGPATIGVNEIPTPAGEGAKPSHPATVVTPLLCCCKECPLPLSSALPAARCPLCAPPHMRAAPSSVQTLPGALMPSRCSLCRRVVGACARARLTLDTVPLSRAGLSSLRAARCPWTSGERARSPSARHLVHTARSSRPRPTHTTHICLMRVC